MVYIAVLEAYMFLLFVMFFFPVLVLIPIQAGYCG